MRGLRGGGGLTCEPAMPEVRTVASPWVSFVPTLAEPRPLCFHLHLSVRAEPCTGHLSLGLRLTV